jgi:hypothetical protein
MYMRLFATTLTCIVLSALTFGKDKKAYDHTGRIVYSSRSQEPTVEYHIAGRDGYCDVVANDVTCLDGVATGRFMAILEDGDTATLVKMTTTLGDPLYDLILDRTVPEDARAFPYRLAEMKFGVKVYCVPSPEIDKHGHVKKMHEVCYGR